MNYCSCAAATAGDDGSDRPACDASHLAEANINPVTCLATDYLSHFIEAIMLLEMMPSAPEFRDEFLRWQPVSYREHFASSRFKTRDTAIAAYDCAEPRARAQLDMLANAMTTVLESTRLRLSADLSPDQAGKLANETAAVLKPLLTRAGAAINGNAQVGGADALQAAVDDLMKA